MTAQTYPTRFVQVGGGRIAYDDTAHPASGFDQAAAALPLVVCTPGMGDNRATYRHLRPLLAEAGYRVVTVDLRGQGETSAVWDDYSITAMAADLLALVRQLDGGPALLVSNSYTGASSFIAAAEAPDLFTALVLTSPFAREQAPLSVPMRAAVFAVAHVTTAWIGYWSSAFKTRKPADHAQSRKALKASLREPGRMAAVRAMMASDAAASEAAAPNVQCPVLTLMGELDQDFKDPAAEGVIVAGMVPNGRSHVIAGAGHYPQTEFPQETADVILPFFKDALTAARRSA
ncbi:MAG: alpha/beta fold hydrolase [Actinocrinis sp.]